MYEIIITRNGVPHETWQVYTDHPERAVDACRAQRIVELEHDLADDYAIVPDTGYTDDQALGAALVSAMSLMPALRERVESRLDALTNAPRERLSLVAGGRS